MDASLPQAQRVSRIEALRRLESLLACHGALLERLHAPAADRARLWSRCARAARRCGDVPAARALLCRASEALRIATIDGGSTPALADVRAN